RRPTWRSWSCGKVRSNSWTITRACVPATSSSFPLRPCLLVSVLRRAPSSCCAKSVGDDSKAKRLAPWPNPDAATLLWFLRSSELRFVPLRHRSVLPRVPLDVSGANRFPPTAEAAPISHGRAPGRREGAFILDRKLELQIFAPVAWRWLRAPILF